MKNFKKIIIIGLLMMGFENAYCQTGSDSLSRAIDSVMAKADTSAPRDFNNTVYVEILGNGGAYSLNFDRLLYEHDQYKAGIRVGFSHFDWKDDRVQNSEFFTKYSITPMFLALNFLWDMNHNDRNYIEGAVLFRNDLVTFIAGDPFTESLKKFSVAPLVAYRWQSVKTGGLNVRAGITYTRVDYSFFENTLWPFISVGFGIRGGRLMH